MSLQPPPKRHVDPLAGKEKQPFAWKRWVGGLAFVVLAIFILQNSQEVQVKFLFAEFRMPLVFALLIAALLGALIGWLLPIVIRSRRKDDEKK